jgi:hypothetical protein
MEIYHVDPKSLTVTDVPSRRDVEKQKHVLLTQGQIVPILFNGRTMKPSTSWHGSPYAFAQIVAAQELEWSTIIITY